jgi:hypothetical protein
MRPDRIVVGECRGGEALDMLQAMNTGHDGSLTTVHANSPARRAVPPRDPGADGRLRPAGAGHPRADRLGHRPHRAAHPPADGTRRITHITEVQGMEGDVITLQDVFLFDYGMGVDEHGKFRGHLKATGVRPKFAEKLQDQGMAAGHRAGDRHFRFDAGGGDRGGQDCRPVVRRPEAGRRTSSPSSRSPTRWRCCRTSRPAADTLNQQIDGIEASGETALYDGIIRATELFAGIGDQIRKNIVVLSDGEDRGVSTALWRMRSRRAGRGEDVRRGVAVFGVRPGPLQSIVAAADGLFLTTAGPRAAHVPVRPDPAGAGQHAGGSATTQHGSTQPGEFAGCRSTAT